MKHLILAVALAATPALAQTSDTPQPGDVAVLQAPDGHSQLTLITPGGYVGFTPGDWAMNGVHGALPAETFEFQIPDAADRNTDDSSNISLAFYQPDTRQARDAQAGFGKSLEPAGRPKKETYKDWTIYTQSIVAKGTPYTLIDAEAREADVNVIVKLNWPHLPGQPGTHNADMRAMLLKTLDSVTAGTGTYTLRPGEQLRRTAQ
jgi:hypothetical protein